MTMGVAEAATAERRTRATRLRGEITPKAGLAAKPRLEVDVCGEYKFGFACYDKLGNLHEGKPEEVTVHVHIAPAAPNYCR